jgi:hypothetical protein
VAKTIRTILFLLSAFSIAVNSGHAQDTPDSDFQVWNETTLIVPMIKKKDEKGKSFDRLSFLILGNLRLGQNRLYPVDRRVGMGFDLKLNSSFSFSPTYYYRNGEDVRNRRDTEHRIRFDLTYAKKWKKFAVKDRNRVEYRIRNSRPDSVRYRNKFTFSVPVINNDKEVVTPFAANEFYYDFREKEFTRNEINLGLSKKLTSNISAEAFYLLRQNRSGTIRTIHGIGTTLKIRID